MGQQVISASAIRQTQITNTPPPQTPRYRTGNTMKRLVIVAVACVAFAMGAIISPLHQGPASAQGQASHFTASENKEIEAVCAHHIRTLQIAVSFGGAAILCQDGTIWDIHPR
jgi:hypothetical protein